MATETEHKGAAIASLNPEHHEQLRSKTLLQRALYRLSRDYLTLTTLGIVALMTILSYSAPIIVQFLDIVYNNNDLYNAKLPFMSRVVDSDSTIFQWVPETASFRRSLNAHNQPVTDIVLSVDATLGASISPDGSLRIWQMDNSRNRGVESFDHNSGQNYSAVDFSPIAAIVATGDNRGGVSLWDPLTLNLTGEGTALMVIAAHEGAVNALAYMPDGASLLTAGADGMLQSWDTASGDLQQSFNVGAPISFVAVSPDGTHYAAVTDAGQISLWNTGGAEAVASWSAGEGINRLRFSLDSAALITANDAGDVSFWTLDGEVARTFSHPAAVNDVRYTPDGSAVVTASQDGVTRVWDLESGEIRQSFSDPQFPYAVTNAVFTPDGTQLLTTTTGRERLYILGTDTSGRDHFSRLLYAGQISLRIGFLAAVGSLTIGVAIGVFSGYFGGKLDDFIVWVITTLDSIPQLYLLLIISSLLAPNDTSLILILVVLGWTGAARIVRGETFSLREREYVVAALALGASNIRIMFYHIVPNVVSVLVIVLARSVGSLILAESSLSFLNFGVKPPTPTWGNMLTGDLQLLREAPHLVFAPGLLITITVLCLFVIGDGLRDAFDPNIAD